MITQDELLGQLGSPYTNKVVDRLRRLAFVPNAVIDKLSNEALNENWGTDNFVLYKYLAVNVAWSIEQGRFTQKDDQFYVSAGHLQTRYGTPLYLVFQRNSQNFNQPFFLRLAGSQISAPELPLPPELPPAPNLDRSAEIVMIHDHILGDNVDRVSFLSGTPPVAQMCAVAGAIQWSMNRGLVLPYWYFGKANYLVPLYLQSRENITLAPDLIAPVQASEDRLLVRTVLLPHMPYANARVAVNRHDKLPHWLLDCWNEESDKVNPESDDD
jgi:hypothetical protein